MHACYAMDANRKSKFGPCHAEACLSIAEWLACQVLVDRFAGVCSLLRVLVCAQVPAILGCAVSDTG
jgi:hypothetical protein